MAQSAADERMERRVWMGVDRSADGVTVADGRWPVCRARGQSCLPRQRRTMRKPRPEAWVEEMIMESEG